jgi:hypothetical protein
MSNFDDDLEPEIVPDDNVRDKESHIDYNNEGVKDSGITKEQYQDY